MTNESLPINDVVRRTGLSARALRFYEARGLVSPGRTSSGRRVFGPADLERLHRLIILKQAGFSLSAIGAILDGGGASLRQVVEMQIAALGAQRERIGSAQNSLRHTLSRIDEGERLDAATFCSLIEQGTRIVTEQTNWKELTDRYLSEDAKSDFAAADTRRHTALPDFDQAEYSSKWEELGGKIEAALGSDPAGEDAQALLTEWEELLAPFLSLATPAMTRDVQSMYADMPNWGDDAPNPGFSPEAWRFIERVKAART
ncbi:hypothetical protein B5C34_08470 [Pacificimonas flava]|uniref:HTH merR-type domain-containing protein n=2 Tax=Pacificimonas TaxID=1960290 RepID=A0A219B6R6_9SPHN|nr:MULTISPECIES: MerR family transcriptional regulator [Pacificimonas]MBZ6379303.1 MerR family transcriptional regulator [Pacificimonas aurantium]OWV33489.1 hypothetical protein B5C34_08470 [Pacificimonas flava]